MDLKIAGLLAMLDYFNGKIDKSDVGGGDSSDSDSEDEGDEKIKLANTNGKCRLHDPLYFNKICYTEVIDHHPDDLYAYLLASFLMIYFFSIIAFS